MAKPLIALLPVGQPDNKGRQGVDSFWLRRRWVDDSTANAWARANGQEPGALMVFGQCGRAVLSDLLANLQHLGHPVRVVQAAPTVADFLAWEPDRARRI